jgi:energy-coupling factor transport system permease protein
MFALLFSFVSVALVIAVSKVPIKLYLKNMKAILPILIFTAIINLFYGDGSTVLVEFWKLSITTEGVFKAVFMATRIMLLIFISSVLTYTTTPNDLTDAIESLLSPLRFLGLKNAVHTLAMMMTIALRFIPTLIEEAEKIMNAQKARGADLESGGIIERVKALIPILIPLLISSVRRAYELAEAMECRCYNGGEGKTRMKQMKLKMLDLYLGVITVLMLLGVILINIIL